MFSSCPLDVCCARASSLQVERVDREHEGSGEHEEYAEAGCDGAVDETAEEFACNLFFELVGENEFMLLANAREHNELAAGPHPVAVAYGWTCVSSRGLAFYRKKSGGPEAGGKSGAIVSLQRTSSDLKLNPHLHAMFLDGAYLQAPCVRIVVHPLRRRSGMVDECGA